MNKWPIILFILLLSLTACKEEQGLKPQELPRSTNSDHSDRINESNVHLELKLQKSIYDVNTKQIKLFINNKGRSHIHTGTSYHIEIYKKDSWYKVPFKKDRGFTMVGIVLKSGKTYEEIIGLESLDFNMIPGKYRVLKEFFADGRRLTLATEFQVK